MRRSNSGSAGPILIVGFGSIGRRHFRNLMELGRDDFVFVRSGNSVLDDAEIGRYPATSNVDEALRCGPSAAVIATPNSLHMEAALKAAKADCDLYIEKPLSHTLNGVAELRREVESRGLIAMVGCQFRFHPLLIELRTMIAAGRLGRVIGAYAEWGEYLPSWHVWEDHRQSYSARDDLGGGVVLTLIHPLDYLYWLFGEWRSVEANSGGIPSLETPAAEDWSDINISFASGVLAQVHLDYIQRPPVHRLKIVGDRGRAVCDFQRNELYLVPPEGEAILHVPPDGFERNTMFLSTMQHFLSCIGQRVEPQCSLNDGEAALRMALAARSDAVDKRLAPNTRVHA